MRSDETRGNKRAFVCVFHGWTYNLDGSLHFVPDEEKFCGLEKDCMGLIEVRSGVWEGNIFVNMDGEAPSLDEYLGSLASAFENFLEDTRFERVATYVFPEVECNWKVAVDAFSEGYHVKTVHRALLSDSYNWPENPYCEPEIVHFGMHTRLGFFANPGHPPLKFESAVMPHVPPSFIGGPAMVDRLPKAINPSRAPNWGFDAVQIFPNYIVLPSNDWFLTYSFIPISVNRTRFEARVYFPRPANAGQRIAYEFLKVLLRDTFREDLRTVEGQQRGLESGVLQTMRIGEQERVLQHNRRVTERYLGGD